MNENQIYNHHDRWCHHWYRIQHLVRLICQRIFDKGGGYNLKKELREINLVDLLELLFRVSVDMDRNGGDLHQAMEMNRKRFKISRELAGALTGVICSMGWE